MAITLALSEKRDMGKFGKAPFAGMIGMACSTLIISAAPKPVRGALNWVQVTGTAAWSGRYGHGCLVHDGKLWVLGGYDYSQRNDVWYSADGADWTAATTAAGWRGRLTGGAVTFAGRMWIMGGNAGGYVNDVWHSTNGVNWTRATGNAAWPARNYLMNTIVDYNGRMWLSGGQNAAGEWRDVWSSTDGTNWTQATAAAPWPTRFSHGSSLFAGRWWLVGGWQTGSLTQNDVWSSTNGVNWTQATATAAWRSRGDFPTCVYDGRMWLMGGSDNNRFNDVWSSTDGANWTEDTAVAPWPARWSHASLLFNDTMWMIGGSMGSLYFRDVWQVIPCIPPTILTQPLSQTTCIGRSATLTVTVSGTPPLAYQWRRSGVSLPGETADVLTIASATVDDTGAYDVSVTNDCGVVISDAAVFTAWPAGTADINGDGAVDGMDVEGFVGLLTGMLDPSPGLASCAADMNGDGVVTPGDLPAIIGQLLQP